MRASLLSIGFALALAGCATSVSVPDSTDENAARIYVIRQRAEPTAWNLGVSIDGKEVASLSNNSYATFKTPSGEHTVSLTWPFLAGQVGLSGRLNFDAKGSHYYVVASRYDFPGFKNNAMLINKSISLIEITKTEADDILAKMSIK